MYFLMRNLKFTLGIAVCLAGGCRLGNKIDDGQNTEYRFPLESEFRPAPLPHQELFKEEEIHEQYKRLHKDPLKLKAYYS